jgi:hypothetical protein
MYKINIANLEIPKKSNVFRRKMKQIHLVFGH